MPKLTTSAIRVLRVALQISFEDLLLFTEGKLFAIFRKLLGVLLMQFLYPILNKRPEVCLEIALLGKNFGILEFFEDPGVDYSLVSPGTLDLTRKVINHEYVGIGLDVGKSCYSFANVFDFGHCFFPPIFNIFYFAGALLGLCWELLISPYAGDLCLYFCFLSFGQSQTSHVGLVFFFSVADYREL